MMRPFFLILFTLLVFTACQEKAPFADCQYGQPTPIFDATHPAVKSHTFTLNQDNAHETVSFKFGVSLDVYQSGCDEIVQEFHFDIPGNYSNAKRLSYWAEMASEQFSAIAGMDETYTPLVMWAQTIKVNKDKFNQNKTVEVEPGYLVTLEPNSSKERTLLVVRLAQRRQ